jgi:leucine dehydrogenase
VTIAPAQVRGSAEAEFLLEALFRRWDGEDVIIRFDRPTGSWIVIALHSTYGGRAGGGTRMRSYPDLAAAVNDAMRLSAGMTAKFAVARFSRGGAKAVISVPPGLDKEAREGLLRRYGALVHELSGLFNTAPDVGTSSSDMDIISETGAPYIFSLTPKAGGSGEPGLPTALGVFHGIRATVGRLFATDSLAGKGVLVQGLGNVGAPLLEYLAEAGADVLFSDVNTEAVQRAKQRFGQHEVDPGTVYDTPCDIFAPCALGGVLNWETIPRLQCRGIAGSANNQLDTAEDAVRLSERGILYAPDFVVNVGGVLWVLGIEEMGWSPDEVHKRIADSVAETLREIFELAAAEATTTTAAAERIVDSRRKAMTAEPD